MKKNTINILGKPYMIIYCNDGDIDGNMGQSNRFYQTIKINKTVAKEQKEETLIHEVLHIVDVELKLGFDENTIARLAVSLYSLGFRL